MRLEVIVVAEARADYEIGFGLAGRVNEETGAGHDLHSRGMDAAEKFTKWGNVKSLAATRNGKVKRFSLDRGPFKGGDAVTAWQVAALCSLSAIEGESPTILLVRDTDNDRERAEELKEAVMRFRQKGLTIMLAQPDPKRDR